MTTLIATLSDFLVSAPSVGPNNWRQGQKAFNLLAQVRPELAEMVRGSDLDPFSNDNRLPEFYSWLARHW